MPRISIIIPNKNYGKFLPECLDSVMVQTFVDWECIVIDDASTDNSTKIIESYCKRDKRFRLVRNKETSGISAARNVGLSMATGDYITFLDSDDCMVETGLETLLSLAIKTNADMIGAQTQIVPDDFKFIPNANLTPTPATFTWQSRVNAFLLWGKSFNWCWIWRRIYKRELIGSTRFRPEFTSMGDDIGFMLDICHKAKRIVETPAISTYHRMHDASVTASQFSEKNFLFFPILMRQIKEELLDKYDTDFWLGYYNTTFRYMLRETIFQPTRLKKHQAQAREVLKESVRLIPKKYLTIKNRIFAWALGI